MINHSHNNNYNNWTERTKLSVTQRLECLHRSLKSFKYNTLLKSPGLSSQNASFHLCPITQSKSPTQQKTSLNSTAALAVLLCHVLLFCYLLRALLSYPTYSMYNWFWMGINKTALSNPVQKFITMVAFLKDLKMYIRLHVCFLLTLEETILLSGNLCGI